MPTKPVWKDITSFSRSDKERKSTTWEMCLSDGLRLVIASNHIDCPGQWIMSCEPWYCEHILRDVKDLEDAQTTALMMVRKAVAELYAELAKL
jgi:hypothetical protein